MEYKLMVFKFNSNELVDELIVDYDNALAVGDKIPYGTGKVTVMSVDGNVIHAEQPNLAILDYYGKLAKRENN